MQPRPGHAPPPRRREVRSRAAGCGGGAPPVKTNVLFQYPAGGLDCAAFDLIDPAVRLDGFADVYRDRQPFDADVFGALDLGDNGTVGAGILVSGEAEGVATACLPVRLPVRALRDKADDILCPRIRQIPQPKVDRIFAALGG